MGKTGIIRRGRLINRRVLVETSDSKSPTIPPDRTYRYSDGDEFYAEMVYDLATRQVVIQNVTESGGIRISEEDESFLSARDAIEFYHGYKHPKGRKNG
jgi:hypothetical protein